MRSNLVTSFGPGLAYVLLLRTILKSPGWKPSAYMRVDASVMGLFTFAEGCLSTICSRSSALSISGWRLSTCTALLEDWMLISVVIISTDFCSNARHGTWHIISQLLVVTTPEG